jgi:ATP-dependent protease HslVU (ClpYQ) peptidase subunit
MRRNQDEELGGTFLVGYKDRLFLIEADYQVGEYEEGYQSCGCGQDYALGALDAMEPSLPAEARIKRALEIASHRSAGVRPPFNILST